MNPVIGHSFNRVMILLSLAVAALAIGVLLIFVWPNHYEPPEALNLSGLDWKRINDLIDQKGPQINPMSNVRAGLFKPATPLRDKPVADKTVERIKSKLKLQCIMEINQEPVAYIQIDGAGLKQCRPGQTIHDLFTVLAIYENRVDLSIIDHKVILRL